jgi:hypothetical protein
MMGNESTQWLLVGRRRIRIFVSFLVLPGGRMREEKGM